MKKFLKFDTTGLVGVLALIFLGRKAMENIANGNENQMMFYSVLFIIDLVCILLYGYQDGGFNVKWFPLLFQVPNLMLGLEEMMYWLSFVAEGHVDKDFLWRIATCIMFLMAAGCLNKEKKK